MLLSHILPKTAELLPMHAAAIHQGQTMSYVQLFQQVSRVAKGLSELPIKPGDRIVLLGHPSPHLLIAECAAVAIGAIPVTLFPELATNEMRQIVQDAAPAAIIYDSENAKLSTFVRLLQVEHAIACKSGEDESGPDAAYSLDGFIADKPALTKWHEAAPDDVALIIYTGGTTGRSKGVMHSHRTLRKWCFMDPQLGGGHQPAKKTIVPNQAHLTGQFILWSSLFEGGTLIYPDVYPLQAEEVVTIIEREQLKYVGTVGLLFRDIVQLPGVESRRLQSLERITCGGAPISNQTFYKAQAVLPNVQFVEVYSQTECGQFISFLHINACFAQGKQDWLRSVGNPAHMDLWADSISTVICT